MDRELVLLRALMTIRKSAAIVPTNYEEAMKLVWSMQNTTLAAIDEIEGKSKPAVDKRFLVR